MDSIEGLPTRGEEDVHNSPYVPLDPRHNEIRLASLAPGHFDDPLVIDLQIRRLSDEVKSDYEALSYVWGQEPCPQQAIVNDRPMRITTNLDSALRHLRSTDQRRLMWIDALCIDQGAVLERNSQVQIMGRIYFLARTVLIWLGPADAKIAEAMNFFLKPSELDDATIVSLTKMYRRPWFYRLWVYQELVLARSDPIIHLGHDSMQWSVFYDCSVSALLKSLWEEVAHSREGAEHSSYMIDFRKAASHVIALSEDRVRRKQRQTLSLLADLKATRFCQATDSRDKVYGLLGLSPYWTPAMTILPNYTKTAQEVFMETTSRILQADMAIALYLAFPLQEWHEPRETASTRMPNLPSWAIDFTMLSKRNSIHVEHLYHLSWPVGQDESKRISGTFARFPTCGKLHTIGTSIGTVEVTSQSLLLHSRWKEDQSTSMSDVLRMLGDIYHGMLKPRDVSIKDIIYTLRPEHRRFDGITMDNIASALEQLFDQTANADLTDDDLTATQKRIVTQITEYTFGEFIFVTDSGRVVTAYHPNYKDGIRPGDVVVGLFREDLPFVLRQVSSNGEYQIINAANVTCHEYRHVALEEAPKSVTEQDVWDNLGQYGLEEYIIV